MSNSSKNREHPRPLLLFFKISVVGLAVLLSGDASWHFAPLSRILAGVSLIVLLPRFGWLVPTMLMAVLHSLGMLGPLPVRRSRGDPMDHLWWIAVVAAGGFVLGCVFDHLAKVSLKPSPPIESDQDSGG